MRIATLLLLFSILRIVHGSSKRKRRADGLVFLNDSNFVNLAQDKIFFVRFIVPWCNFCKNHTKAWDKMAETLVNRTDILVGEVNCSSSGTEILCDSNGIEVFPTMKYGDGQFLKNFVLGVNTFEDLMEFVEMGLDYTCSPRHFDKCEDKEKRVMEYCLDQSKKKLQRMGKSLEDKFGEMEEEFQSVEVENFFDERDAAKKILESEYYGKIRKIKMESDYHIIQDTIKIMEEERERELISQ